MQFISLRHRLTFDALPGVVLPGIGALFLKNAMNLFSTTGYVSTNMILISIGISAVGLVLLATAAIVYTLIALLKGNIKFSSSLPFLRLYMDSITVPYFYYL